MTTGVFLAVLLAAAMHAGWNAVLKVRLEPFAAITLVTGLAGVVGLPFLIALGLPRAEAWPWLFTSVAIHLAYNVALSAAYRHADMGQVYPIARGGAPLLTALGSVLLLREPFGAVAGIGVVVLGLGICLMSLGSKDARLDRRALGYALLTAVTICAYTIVDGVGARAAGDPHAYSAALFVLDGIPLPSTSCYGGGCRVSRRCGRSSYRALQAEPCRSRRTGSRFWAMTLAPIPLVAALRETSVLFAALIAALV
jgi:drug/metabolite transporter (DMT)-like permease